VLVQQLLLVEQLLVLLAVVHMAVVVQLLVLHTVALVAGQDMAAVGMLVVRQLDMAALVDMVVEFQSTLVEERHVEVVHHMLVRSLVLPLVDKLAFH